MNLVNFGGLIGDAIADTWMSIWLSINSMVYSIIELLYKVFVAVANVNLFGEDVFNKIVKRVYIVMAIAMLFIFAYNLVLMIINPDDKKSTGQMTKMIKETIISLVLIVLLPTIFNYMSIFQRHVLDSNILGQIILGDVGGIASKDELTTYCEKYKKYTIIEDKTDIGDRRYNWGYVVGGTAAGAVGGAGVGALIGGGAGLIASLADYFSQEYKNANEELFKGCLLFNAKSASSRGAATIAPTIFSAFYHPTKYGYFECADFIENGVGKYDSYTTNYIKTEDDKKMCSYYYYSVNMAKFTGSISAFNEESYFYSKVKKDDGTFEFNYILALVAGVLAVYMFACYTMSIGVRVAKLGFLQIISPLTVMMRIIPKKKEAIYDKWQKMLLDTYLDVFIRLLIIYFSLFSISLVPNVIHTLFSSFEGGGITGALVNSFACVIVILGILKFAQDAPGLFKEFFGGSGSFALKSPSKQLSENKLGGSALGFVGGGLSSAAGNIWNSGKNLTNAQGFKGKAKALTKGIGSTASGTLGGAIRGAKNGYGSTGFKDLNRNIAEAKYATDAAQSEGFQNTLKHKAQKIGDGFVGFGQFISGSGASNFKLQAVEGSLKDIQNINANFKNGKIEGLESAYSKMNDDYNNNKPLNFNGRQYERNENGWVNRNNSKDVLSHDAMGKAIKDHFDALKKSEYVSQYTDNEKAFERLTSKMINTLNDNLPKVGNDVLEGINKKLEGSGIKFDNIDEITSKIGEFMKEGNKSGIYDINDALEKNLKNVKKEVIIAQHEKKDK